jgi:hypothetical protein
MAAMSRRDFVRSSERKRVSRPQPPMGDRRTKRQRDRGSAKRAAIHESR